MVQAYSQTGLNEPAKAVKAMQLVTAAEDPPSTNLYQQLAQLAYLAGETRTGDLAAERAVDLAPENDRKALRDSAQVAEDPSHRTARGDDHDAGEWLGCSVAPSTPL